MGGCDGRIKGLSMRMERLDRLETEEGQWPQCLEMWRVREESGTALGLGLGCRCGEKSSVPDMWSHFWGEVDVHWGLGATVQEPRKWAGGTCLEVVTHCWY